MTVALDDYVPILKWRQGEYQALMRVDNSVKGKIVPLIVVPPIEYDFETQSLKKTAQEHIEPFPKRLFDKWGTRPVLIDFHSSVILEKMDSGDYVPLHIFSELRNKGCNGIPVTTLERDMEYNGQVKLIVAEDSSGICLRVTLAQIMDPGFNLSVVDLFKLIGVDLDEVDIVLDLEEPDNFEPYAVFSNIIIAAISRINNLAKYRSFVLSGMSLKMREVVKPGAEVPRHEWILYKLILGVLNGMRVPAYSDYTIVTPEFFSLDMRMMKPAGKIVYTCDDTWLIPKGSAFRGSEHQMVDHCNAIVTSGKYAGPKFSFGDKRIEDTSIEAEGCGNLSTWKQVGVNHHIETVESPLANLHAGSAAP
jgi:hypothetical protein